MMMVAMRVIAIQMKITFLTVRTSQTWAKEKGTIKGTAKGKGKGKCKGHAK